MLPDGVHKYEYDYSIFKYRFLNQDLYDLIQQVRKSIYSMDLQILKFSKENKNWEKIYEIQGFEMNFIILEKEPYNLVIKQGDIEVMKFEHHSKFDVAIIKPNFFSFCSKDGEQYGINIQNDNEQQRELIKDICTFYNELEGKQGKNQEFREYYFFNLVKNTKSDKVKRGLITRSIAVCSDEIQIMWFLKPILQDYLIQYSKLPVDPPCEQMEGLGMILEGVYESVNKFVQQIPIEYLKLNYGKHMCFKQQQQGEFMSVGKKDDEKFQGKEMKYMVRDVEKQTQETKFMDLEIESLYRNSFVEKVSLLDFIQKFQENTMVIYNAILMGKKVIFIGYERMIQENLEFIACCEQMLRPFNIVENVYPYEHLLNLEFTEKQNYIVAVSNPIFNSRDEWYDVCADIVTGKVMKKGNQQQMGQGNGGNNNGKEKKEKNGKTLDDVLEEKLWQIDQQFIRQILNDIKNGAGDEGKIRDQFYRYTSNFINLILNVAEEMDFRQEDRGLNDAFQRKMSNFSRTYLYKSLIMHDTSIYLKGQEVLDRDQYQGLYKCVQIVKSNKILDNQQLWKFYNELVLHTQSQEIVEGVIGCVYEKWGNLDIMGLGLFSQDQEIVDKNMELLEKLEGEEYGKKIVKKLNFMTLQIFQNQQDKKKANKNQ